MAAQAFDRIPFEDKKEKNKSEKETTGPALLYIKLVGRLREINLIKDAGGLREPRRSAGFEATWIDVEDGGAERGCGGGDGKGGTLLWIVTLRGGNRQDEVGEGRRRLCKHELYLRGRAVE